MNNPFDRFADQQMPVPVKAKYKAQEKRVVMKLSKQEQDQANKNTQLKIWRAFHRAEIEFITNGRYRKEWRELVCVIKQMTIYNPADILKYIATQQWLLDADLQTRRIALSRISRAIIKLREADGRPPFDDSLPGEDPTVFEIIRESLKVMTP